MNEPVSAQELTLELRVEALERRIDVMWKEIFSAYERELAQGGEGRSTLKGVIDKLCEVTGVESVASPWSFRPKRGHERGEEIYMHSDNEIQNNPEEGERCNAEIERRFRYHAPEEDQSVRYSRIRETAKHLAYVIDQYCPDSREKSLALTNLEQATMWANASIARNE